MRSGNTGRKMEKQARERKAASEGYAIKQVTYYGQLGMNFPRELWEATEDTPLRVFSPKGRELE